MPPRKKKELRPDGVLAVVEEGASEDDRASEAYWLRQDKFQSWEEVAAQVGYASPAAARISVHAWLQRAALERGKRRRQQALEHELSLFDQIELVLLPRVLDGDLKATEALMRAVMNRSKLEGLLETDTDRNTQRTVVVTSENFAKIMQDVALGRVG